MSGGKEKDTEGAESVMKHVQPRAAAYGAARQPGLFHMALQVEEGVTKGRKGYLYSADAR